MLSSWLRCVCEQYRHPWSVTHFSISICPQAQAQAATQAERATFLAAVDLNRKTQTELPPVESATVSSDKLRED
jgi:hypothetical protein